MIRNETRSHHPTHRKAYRQWRNVDSRMSDTVFMGLPVPIERPHAGANPMSVNGQDACDKRRLHAHKKGPQQPCCGPCAYRVGRIDCGFNQDVAFGVTNFQHTMGSGPLQANRSCLVLCFSCQFLGQRVLRRRSGFDQSVACCSANFPHETGDQPLQADRICSRLCLDNSNRRFGSPVSNSDYPGNRGSRSSRKAPAANLQAQPSFPG